MNNSHLETKSDRLSSNKLLQGMPAKEGHHCLVDGVVRVETVYGLGDKPTHPLVRVFNDWPQLNEVILIDVG